MDTEKWNEAYPWAPVSDDPDSNYVEYMEVQAQEPGRSGRSSAAAADWRNRVRASIDSDRYGGPGVPVPGLAEYLEARRAGGLGSITFSQWREERGGISEFTNYDEYVAEKGPGPYEPSDTYAVWLLEHPE